jgi:Ribbon-helix-helix protein, copG family
MAKKKKQHGGAREGSGRKQLNPEGPAVTAAFAVPQGLLDQVDAIARRTSASRSRIVTEAIRAYIGTPKRG